MSVKNMLPIIGVGSAAALIGLVASRRAASRADASSTSKQRPSGIVARRSGHAASSHALPELPDAPHGLPSGFWDAAPESTGDVAESRPPRYVLERDESSDRDDLSADWLARATQAPLAADDESDDPAEIAADSLSMISDASRRAAAQAEDDDAEVLSER